MLYPDMGEELAFHERLTCGGVPVPVSDSEARELLALLENESVAEADPAFCGVKSTFSWTLCPAAIVNGKETPGNAN